MSAAAGNGIDRRILDFAAGRNLGVLSTQKRDGRPQLSPINYTLDPETGTVRISITADRAKARNAARDPRVSLFVWSEDGWSYVVLEGEAELSPVAERTDDATVEALVDTYRSVRGEEHPDWDDYRRAMVADRRLVLTIHASHGYGAPPG